MHYDCSCGCKRERDSVAPPEAEIECVATLGMHFNAFTSTKHDISPCNGPILTVQMPALLFIVVACEAMIAGGGL